MKKQIEALRETAKKRFDGAQSPEEIKAATEELAQLDEIEKETAKLEEQNASLLASYKEIVKREPVSNEPEEDEEQRGQGLSFEQALKKVIEAEKK